jgi:hypothetical protein
LLNNWRDEFKKTDKELITTALLPAFDWNYQIEDSEFKKKYVGYREKDGRGKDVFHRWVPYARVEGYLFFGPEKRSFVSRDTMHWNFGYERWKGEARDPVLELRFAMWNKKEKEKDLVLYNKYCEPPPKEKKEYEFQSERLPRPQPLGAFNVYGTSSTSQKDEQNGVMFLPWAYLQTLYTKGSPLDQFRDPDATPIDEANPKYKYGNIFDPNLGMRFEIKKQQVPGEKVKTRWSIVFPEDPENIVLKPYGEDVLVNRHNLWDETGHPFFIPSYQEVIEILINEVFDRSDIEFVKSVCGKHADINVAGEGANKTYFQGTEADFPSALDDEDDDLPGLEEPEPVKDERVFAIIVVETKEQLKKQSPEDVRKLIKAGTDIRIMEYPTGKGKAWDSPTKHGFAMTAVAKANPPPAATPKEKVEQPKSKKVPVGVDVKKMSDAEILEEYNRLQAEFLKDTSNENVMASLLAVQAEQQARAN